MITNIAGYRFVPLSENQLLSMRDKFKNKAQSCDLKGTVLLSSEGINLFLAGQQEDIDTFRQFLLTFSEFSDVSFKKSITDYRPFNRLLVRIKKEIIPFGQDSVKPAQKAPPYISPETLKQWYQEKRDMIMLDVRNEFEVALGTFQHAIDLGLKKFRDFPEAVDWLPTKMKQKPIVTFCTGGIRCEKAAEWMRQKGFNQVYQLDGGILHYFEKCGGAFFNGECFVFDQRVAVDSTLRETKTAQCFDCRTPLPKQTIKNKKCSVCGSDLISKQV